MLGYVNSLEKKKKEKKQKKKKKKKRGDVTIYCDTPCVRDLGALFGHVIKNNQF